MAQTLLTMKTEGKKSTKKQGIESDPEKKYIDEENYQDNDSFDDETEPHIIDDDDPSWEEDDDDLDDH